MKTVLGDLPWIDLTPFSDFEMDSSSRLRAKVVSDMLIIDIYNVICPDIEAGHPEGVIRTMPPMYKPIESTDITSIHGKEFICEIIYGPYSETLALIPSKAVSKGDILNAQVTLPMN
ncbi:hypothetical protein [Lactococcus cremoris]|uniref:Uncharacterized protein n=1 Tax=Lactococcus lactis subsp. cremoris TaxID=1359 RepID=A0AAX4A9V9_LACLC|nr:hypothetical protein [Lactococcus cremoris]KGH34590.1 hypothetical protein JL36_01690 [Lactococcus cremoris]QSE62587.1 hypothetical protein JWR96_06190 [Lactococcus cremoris]WMX70389.1 hypothetical protein RF668_10880 [Lactococcus cremoris]